MNCLGFGILVLIFQFVNVAFSVDCIPLINDAVPIISGLNGTATADTVINAGKKIAESLIKTFSDFKTTFNKTYASKAEELLREGIFNVSLALINGHNELYKQGKASYALAMNIFGDWAHDEYLKILGTKTENSTNNDNCTCTNHRSKRQTSEGGSCNFPTEKDWRKDGAVTPVKYQAQCGSCWAFAVAACLESHFFIKSGRLYVFSEQFLVDCSDDYGCQGGSPSRTLTFIEMNGIVDDRDSPYVAYETGKGSCNKFPYRRYISGYKRVPQGDESALKDVICRNGPVIVSVDASSEKFQFYKKGIFNEPSCSSTDINHGMLAVGYGVDKVSKAPYWLVKNSYATGWGEEGYIRYPRDSNNYCGIATDAVYPII